MSGELSHLNPTSQGEKQRAKILAFIRSSIEHDGFPPTVREIGEAVGLESPSTVHRHLTLLVEQGRIVKHPTKPRALRIMPDDAA